MFDVFDVNDYSRIPGPMRASLVDYVIDGVPPGGFLSAVIRGGLHGAAAKADATNLPILAIYSAWLHNVPPWGCYGSEERMRDWIDMGGFAARFSLSDDEREQHRQRLIESFEP